MFHQTDHAKKIADVKELIARTEERVRKFQARAKPGAARMVHALTNSIRKYRRDLRDLLTRQANQNQLRLQQSQMQQAKRDATDRSGELPDKQDQEPRKPTSDQGALAGQ